MIVAFSGFREYFMFMPSCDMLMRPVFFNRFICQVKAWKVMPVFEASSLCVIWLFLDRRSNMLFIVACLRSEIIFVSSSVNVFDWKYLLYMPSV